MQKASKYIATATILLLAVLLLIWLIGGVGVAYAATADNNSFVLYDLQKDSKFNEDLYPEKKDDYSLDMITIGESANDELFVYVYQPSGKSADLRATSINISNEYKPKKLSFRNYKLTFCNSYKTLYKYKVDDFQVEDKRTRYYDIPSIYRAWNKDYGDAETGNDNTISEVPYGVNRIFEMSYKDGEYTVTAVPTNTIEVVAKYVGFVRYKDGYKLFTDSACDSHFVAFSTDIPIEKLHSADIYFCTQSLYYHERFGRVEVKFGKITDTYISVEDSESLRYEPSGWFNVGTINRDRIQTVDDFIENEDFTSIFECGLFNVVTTSKLTQEGKENLQKCDWLIRFFDSSYSDTLYYNSATHEKYAEELSCTIVSDVSILRLEGISNGSEFNLGVVDNKQSGSLDPINDWTVTVTGTGKNWLRILKIVLVILAFIVFVLLAVWLVRTVVVPAKRVGRAVKSIKNKRK